MRNSMKIMASRPPMVVRLLAEISGIALLSALTIASLGAKSLRSSA